MNRLTEINERLAELLIEVRSEDSDLEKLENEIKELKAEKEEIMEKINKREELLEDLKEDKEVEVLSEKENESEERKMDKVFGAETKEYRSAYLKNLVGKELTVEERAAFTHTTANTENVLPTTMLNEIWDLVSEKHVIMNDVKTYRINTALEIVKHTAIVQGKAKVVAENAENDDEKNTFLKVTLNGKDFSKHVELSYAMAKMSIDALEQYLISEIAESIGEALADDTVATIKTDIATVNKVNTAKVKELGFTDLTGAFAKLKKVSDRVVYVNNATFYNYIVSMVDTTGRPLFQPNLQDDAQGILIGAKVKIEESVKDNEILIGDPQMVVHNVVQDLLIEQDKDIKAHKHIYSGYMRAESALINDTSFSLLTVKQSQ